jgi:outer membrane biosynthesis protein TonB
MKFAPEHRPLTMTGVASLAGLAVFMILFFLTATLLTGSEANHAVTAIAGTDTVAVRGPVADRQDSSSTTDPATPHRMTTLTESVRASLLAAAAAAQHRQPLPQVKAPVTQQRRDPRVRTVPPPTARQKAPAGKPRTVVLKKVNGSVTQGSIQWIGGGRRRKASGAPPAFPAGVSSDVQIKVEAVVAPDGRVRSVRPGQKGNAKCEDAAIRAVQRWKFDRLPRSVPQRDQRCVVSFSFNVK